MRKCFPEYHYFEEALTYRLPFDSFKDMSDFDHALDEFHDSNESWARELWWIYMHNLSEWCDDKALNNLCLIGNAIDDCLCGCLRCNDVSNWAFHTVADKLEWLIEESGQF